MSRKSVATSVDIKKRVQASAVASQDIGIAAKMKASASALHGLIGVSPISGESGSRGQGVDFGLMEPARGSQVKSCR